VPHRLALVVALVVALWATATAFGLAIGALTKVGPVVLTLSRSHGVHMGDLVALTAAYAEAALLTRRLLRRA
jgi:hypothetical protein